MKQTERNVDYSAIANSSQFKQLIAHKKAFILPWTLFFFAFYFTLPILTSYTTVLNNKAIGFITWAWVFAFGQFIMTWALCSIYTRRAAKFDEEASKIVASIQQGGSSR